MLEVSSARPCNGVSGKRPRAPSQIVSLVLGFAALLWVADVNDATFFTSSHAQDAPPARNTRNSASDKSTPRVKQAPREAQSGPSVTQAPRVAEPTPSINQTSPDFQRRDPAATTDDLKKLLPLLLSNPESKRLAAAVELQLRKGDVAGAKHLLESYVEASTFAALGTMWLEDPTLLETLHSLGVH